MSKDEFIIIHDTAAPKGLAQTIFSKLDPENCTHYLIQGAEHQNIFSLIRHSFHMTHSITKGVTQAELDEMISSESEPKMRTLLEEARKLKSDETMFSVGTDKDEKSLDSTVLYARFLNNKYNILQIEARQEKEIDKPKAAAFGISSGGVGLVTGAVLTPFIGGVTVGALLLMGGINTYYNYRKELNDVICGRILQDLLEQKVIHIDNGRLRIENPETECH